MDFPDPRVREIVDGLKKDLNSGKSIDLATEIKFLSLSQRFQIFCLVKDWGIPDSELFSLEKKIWEKFHELFRSDYTETSYLIENFDYALGLAETALLSGLYDLEDYRTIIRYLYTNGEDNKNIVLKLNKHLLHYLHLRGVDSQILDIFSLFLRFLGVPLATAEELKVDLLEFFPEAKSEINAFFELPISTIQRYPEYIDEIAEQLNYDRDVPILKKWLDHETLTKLKEAKINKFTRTWKPKTKMNVDEFVNSLEANLSKLNISSLPLVFNSFVKPYCDFLKPKQINPTELSSNIPSEILETYVEKFAYSPKAHKEVKIRVTFLGGAQIGTMGILISTPQSNILIDYGMSVANYQIPYWNEALNQLDAILVTHAHLDHVGAIPYLYAQGYKGYVFGSGMTKNFTNFLLMDNLELMSKNISASTREADHRFKYLSQSAYVYQMLDNYITVVSNKEYQITPDTVIIPIPAFHIQGSFGYLVKCGNKNILFSGDVNLDPTALFRDKSPQLPLDADLSIIDCTYYGQPTFDLAKRDKLLFKAVKEDKRVIIPAFSVGRAQEILIKLEKKGLTKERKVNLLGMATKVARISGLKTRGHLSDHLVQPFEDEVLITGGGMLSGGFAREFVEQTKEDPDTTIILSGFLAKNTLGYRLLHKLEPHYKQKVVFARFSGHSSSKTLATYLDSLKGQKVLVHLGNLTKDPFTSEEVRRSKDFSHPDHIIPFLGSSIEI